MARARVKPDDAPTPTPPPCALANWADRFRQALDVFHDLAAYLTSPPAGSDPALALGALLDVWARCGVNGNLADPVGDFARQFAGQKTGDHAQANLRDLLRISLGSVERMISRALDGGAAHPLLIHTRDFGTGAVLMESG